MARRYSGKRGKHGSKKPFRKTLPKWIRYDAKEIEQLVIKLAKEEKTSSQIGMVLRDSYGIPDVKKITNKTVTKILEENKQAPELPEDFIALVKKQMNLLKHLEKNKKDMTARRGLYLTESKLKRLTKYYKNIGKFPADWKYDIEKTKLLTGG